MPGEEKALARFLLEMHGKQKPEKACEEMSEGQQSWRQKEGSPEESWDVFPEFSTRS